MITGADFSMSDYVKKALSRTKSAYRPSTLAAQRTDLRTYLAFVTYMGILPQFTIQTVLSFLEFLYSNAVSPRVIANYVSSLKTAAKSINGTLNHCITNWFLLILEVFQSTLLLPPPLEAL